MLTQSAYFLYKTCVIHCPQVFVTDISLWNFQVFLWLNMPFKRKNLDSNFNIECLR
jgi:hypothetical protein